MTEEVKETVRRIFWEAYSPLLEDLAKKEDRTVQSIFDEMVLEHIGGWDFIYAQAQIGLDAGESLGEQERRIKTISQLFKKMYL